MTVMTLQMCEEAAMAAIALQAARRPPEAPQAHAAMLKPLDPDVVSASIPAFFIGRDKAGLWVAREANGRIGRADRLAAPRQAYHRRARLGHLKCNS